MAMTRAKARALEMAKVVDCETRGANFDSAIEMKPRLWSNLPEHLIERILARLPVACFFKFRCVCKSWHSLIYSPDFLKTYAEAPPQGPWFLMFTTDDYRDGSTFDPILNKWHHIPLPSVPLNETFFPAAAAGGLVCFGCYNDGWKNFVVCNPLTKAWRELPPMLNPPFRLYTVGMVVDRDTTSYKVLVAGNCEIYEVIVEIPRLVPSMRLCTMPMHDSAAFGKHLQGSFRRTTIYACSATAYAPVYDSATNCWKKTCILPPGFYRWHHGVLCNGFLYSRRFQFDGLVAYDMEQGVWSRIQAPMPQAFDYHALVECQGRIFTVGGLLKNDITQRICILELERTRLEWVEVDSMPSMLCDEFLREGASFSCTGYSDLVLIYITGGLRDRLVLLYDLSNKLWRRLPRCSLPDHRMRDGLLDGISFEPRLDACV